MKFVSMPTYKLRTLWFYIGGLLVALILFLSLTPDPPAINPTGSDKFAHVLTYGTLMLWFMQLYPISRRIIIAVGLIAMGVLLELLQGFTGARSSDYMDIIANTGGVMLGWLLGKARISATLEALEKQTHAFVGLLGAPYRRSPRGGAIVRKTVAADRSLNKNGRQPLEW